MTRRDRPVNSTAAALLGFLHEGPMSGWDLVAVAEERIGDFWTVTRSQVYRELEAMAASGLIEPGATGPRQRVAYEITAPGRAALAEFLAREPGPEHIRYPLLLTIAFGAHLPPGRLAGYAARHRRVHAERLGRYRAQREAAGEHLDVFAAATLDFGIRYEQAVLEWFDDLCLDDLPPPMAGPVPSVPGVREDLRDDQ